MVVMGGWDGEGGRSLVRKIVIKDDSTSVMKLLLPEHKSQYDITNCSYIRSHEPSKLMEYQFHISNDPF